MNQDVSASANASFLRSGAVVLDHLGLIRVRGVDAARFLQGQLTQDVALLPVGGACFAAYCSPKGRVLASLIGLKFGEDDIALVVPRSTVTPTLKRLSMYVLRSKAVLTDESAIWRYDGLVGAAVQALVGRELAQWKTVQMGDGMAIGLHPADGHPRAMTVRPIDSALADAEAPGIDRDAWRWSDVASGVASVTAPTMDLFVPQMLNYESVGAVSFKKGCYPGQEVVARSQFRGTLKRRAFIVHCDASLAPAQEVFTLTDAEQPCGTIVEAARAPGGGWDAIASLQVAAAEAGGLVSGAAPLTVMPLPYRLVEDV